MRSEDAVGLINGPRRDLACSDRKFSVIVGHPQQISRFDVQLRQYLTPFGSVRQNT